MTALETYIKQIEIDLTLKKEILKLYNNNTDNYHFKYATLFSPIKSKHEDELNIAGFFYFQYCLLIDDLIDNDKLTIEKPKLVLLADACIEEALKILYTIFNPTHNFWKLKSKRKIDFIKGQNNNNQLTYNTNWNEFETFADQKSAFAKLAIDANFSLGLLDDKEYQKLLICQKYLSSAFQLYDDVQDFKIDFKTKSNMAVSLFISSQKIEDIAHLEINDVDRLHKLFFIKGYSVSILKTAELYCNKALECLDFKMYPSLSNCINAQRKIIKTYKENILYYTTSILIKSKLKYDILDKVPSNYILLNDTKKRAINYILSAKENNGNWLDMPVNSWFSGYWTVGFILYNLHNSVSSIEAKPSIDYLLKLESGLYPYIEHWIADADTTNFVFLSFLVFDINIPENRINELLKYQNDDGGFRTYMDADSLIENLDSPLVKDVTGWVHSHTCVSAGTLLLLAMINNKFKSKNVENSISKLTQYIINECNPKTNSWDSYWWTSEVYSFSFITMANFYLKDKQIEELVQKAGIKILEQMQDGFVNDEFTQKHFFYTGLLVQAFCSNDALFLLAKDFINKAIDNFYKNQFSDGSWASSYSLRIPSSTIINPNTIENWDKYDTGSNVLIIDEHRLVTTATVIRALQLYLDKSNHINEN